MGISGYSFDSRKQVAPLTETDRGETIRQLSRIGMLICSDSYFGLLPRMAALKGVDLLWVPANWPPGELNPLEIWRARAMENGYYLAAVNRTGKDRRMDCREACSCVFDPEGAMIFSGASAASKIYTVSIPLDKKGKIKTCREQCLKGRDTRYYGSMYLNFRRVKDLTEHFRLPAPGILTVHCLVPESEVMLPFQLEHQLEDADLKEGANLFLLPPLEKMAVDPDNLARIARTKNIGIFTRYREGSRDSFFLATPEGGQSYSPVKRGAFPTACYGPAKIAMFSFDAFPTPSLR